jgi:hypothetical protein
MPMADPIREAVIAGASTAEVKRTAIATGMCTLRRSGINKIAEGVTTVEEYCGSPCRTRRRADARDDSSRRRRRSDTPPSSKSSSP